MQAAIKTAHAERFVSAFADFPANTVFYQPPPGQWTHLAMTYDGALIKIYANGVQVGEDTKTGNITGDNVPFDIGGRSAGLKFTGLIDEVEVFDGALTSQEIFDIYSAVTLGKCKHGLIQFSAPTYVANEGSPSVIIRVKRTDGGVGAVSVHYATSNGTATAGSDYTATSGDLNWADGDTSDRTFTIPITDDGTYEGDETVNIALTNATGGAQIGPQGTAGLTIIDNDAAPAFSIDDVTHDEGDAGTTSYTFTVTKTGTTDLISTVDFATADSTATTVDGDYVATNGTLTFAPGDTTKQFTVLVNGDTKFENDETFVANLTNPTNATISDDQGVGTITNDDAPPSFSIDDVIHNEGNTGTTSYTFTVTKTGSTALSASVDYETMDGTAVAPGDYTAIPITTLTFAPGDTTMQVTVFVNGDTTYETNEIFTVHLSNPSDATISDADGTGTITNDDAPPAFSIDDVSNQEGNTGTTSYTFTVTKTGATEVSSSVVYETVNGTAVAPGDFTAIPQTTLTFAAGDTQKQVTALV